MSKLKYFGIIFLISTAVLFILPFLAVKYVPADGGMAVCFLIFYAVLPMLSLAVGVNAGRELRRRFWAPIVPAAVFLISMWMLFDFGEPAFALYGAVSLAIGAASMVIRHFFA